MSNHSDASNGGPAADAHGEGEARLDEETQSLARRLSFPVVAIGASAGGLEALEALTHRLAACPMAFVVIQHLAPGHLSMLAEILQRGTTLPVVTIAHGTRLEPGRIHVAPPTGQLSVEDGEFRLLDGVEARGARHNIDAFFRSLALAGGPMAIGVVLSGSGSDGTIGLKSIKDEGGITFAQEPSTASQPSMPQSAIDAGCADSSLPPAEIGAELMRLAVHSYVGPHRQAKLIDGEGKAKILARLRIARGVDFSQYKPGTVERRIARRMALHKIEHVEAYAALLESTPAELQSLYDDLLIGVTSFFRDSEPFDALKHIVFPLMVEGRPEDSVIRIWVAGCSSGEEAYSIAMVLLEFLGPRASFSIQIFATDVDESALALARLGVYPLNIEADVSPERLQRFFVRVDKGYQVARQVREVVVFARHNLGRDPPFSRLDVVTCRNVLIYMQAPLQKRVLRIFHYALNPGAHLLLGTSESVADAAHLFSLVDRKHKVYAKKNVAATAFFDFGFSGRPSHEADAPAARSPARLPASLAQLADRKIIEKYGRPGVIIDDHLDVVQYRGRTGEYLEPGPGAATFNLLKLARPELLIALRTAVQQAVVGSKPSISPVVHMASPRGPRDVSVEVLPLPEVGPQKYLLVVFNELSSPAPAKDPDHEEASGSDSRSRVADLETELATNKEYLKSTVEELEAANEELQSSNEELQSSNEELQSINEELETSKEELQSINEELATVNDELQDRVGQLGLVNDDLQNMLSNTGSSIVIVGSDLRIRRFSRAAEKLLSLIPADVGRPISYLRNVMSAREIDATATEAISSIATREQRVRCIDGSWYIMKMVPYVTADHAIRGLVLEFVNTPPPPAAGDHAVPELAQRVLATLTHPVMLVDRPLRLVWANRLFFERFSVSPAALERPLFEAWGSKSQPPELWAFLEDLVAGRSARDVVIEGAFGRPSARALRFSGQIVSSDGDRPLLAIVHMQEA